MKRALVVRLLLIFAATCAATFSAGAQQPKKVPRIAYAYLYDVGPSAPYTGPFRARMRELGWIEGTNLIFETYDAGGNPDKLAVIMRQLVDSNVDLIVASCTPEAKAAQKVTSNIPIVFAATGDPVKAGVVASLGRPGGNATGLAVQLLELSGKRMEILKEVSPGLRRATVLWNPVRPDNAPEVSALQQAARTLGFVIESQQVRSRDEIDVALDAILKDKSQAITETGDPLMASEMKRIIEFANGARLPAIYDERGYADAGGLMSYGPDLPTMNRRAADYGDKILKGAKPADLPVEQPTKFELVINMKTAKALGIPIPQSLLLRADAVIQ